VVLDGIEVVRTRLPLVEPFEAAYGALTERDVLYVHVVADGVDGWGECGALAGRGYTDEFTDGAESVVRDQLAPLLLAAGSIEPEAVAGLLAAVPRNPMAKAAVETAVLDASLRASGRSLADRLGGCRSRVPAGVAVGLAPSVAELLARVRTHVGAGYRRVKLKIAPGHDVGPVRAVRTEFGPDLVLLADANGSYGHDADAAASALALLDEFGLAAIEQPLHRDVALEIAAALAQHLATPVCFDEAISSAASAARALDSGACAAVCVKAPHVGGYLEAVRVHDACVGRGAAAYCGGMLDTGIGRAANLALASLPGFTLPGDLSANGRWFASDVTPPIALGADGCLPVPSGPGLGVEPSADMLPSSVTSRSWVEW
jgi:O-succinylbenzoate synthase